MHDQIRIAIRQQSRQMDCFYPLNDKPLNNTMNMTKQIPGSFIMERKMDCQKSSGTLTGFTKIWSSVPKRRAWA